MSDIYDELEEIKRRHEIEKHNELKEEYQVDPSCLKCYSTDEIEIGDWFKRFWKIFQKVILEAMSYNRNTYTKLMEYIILTRKDGEESYPSSKKKRNKEFEKMRKEGEKLLDIVVRSIRYRNKSDYRKMGIISVIKVICEHYILSEDNEFILDDRTEENLLGNKELLTYRYIIEDDELDIRFAKFEEWLEEIESVTIKNKGYGTIRNFKEILHLEENIAEEENRGKIKKFQKKKIVETKGFVEEQSDVGELESSDDLGESSSNEGDEHIERIYRNYWLENGYEIDVEEIRRIINFRVEHEIMKTKDFMESYIKIKELDDEEIIGELRRWYTMNATECPLCNKMILKKEAVKYNKEFTGEICKSCSERKENDVSETELRVKRIQKICEGAEVEVMEGEILRMINMGYTDGEILNWKFIKLFQENKNELEGEGNSEDFNENEVENNDENIINTGGFGLSQNSDSNNSLNIKDSDIKGSDSESEVSDYNLQDLFQENILLDMANQDQIKRIVENAIGLAPNTLDNVLGAGQTLIDRIQTAGMGGIVGMSTFSGKEDEDVNDWIRQFEVAFTVNGRTEGNIGGGICSQNKANVAITCLRGTALQWYNEEKERVAANLVNWCDHNDDRNLKNKLIDRFTRKDVKRRKMIELTRIKQEKNESVEEYNRRFKSIVRIATRVRRSNPTNLNNAINIARREEEAKNELIMKITGVNIEQIRQEKNIEEILKEETNKKEENEIYKKMQKPVNEKDIDELSKALEQFRAEKIAMEETLNEIKNQQRRNINRNTNTRNARIIRCYECNEVGHIKPECSQLRQRNNYRTQNNFYRNNNERRNNNGNRNINLMDHERYYDNGNYYNNYEIYNYEKEIFPTLRSGRKYGRDLDNDYDEMEIEDVPIPPKREYDMKMDIDGERKRRFSNKEDRDKAYQSRRIHNQCERCGLRGHFIKECPNPGMKRGNKNIRVRVNVPPEKYVMDMYNEKANITYGQIYNENPKFRRIARNYDEDDNA
ncbi:hypothetical protein GLOIN_2v1847961 [Rhizophagus irregularis DAOM 181602=DAOM 197198]|nr:hypothetical protein GLOIN_2v1847961 [Rhizophagus irregularis DAOM 181602=DAOM 197198]